MPAALLNANLPSPFRRLVASIGVALVLLLGIATVSPALHDHLHGADAAHAAADTCAVVLFGTGLTLALTAIALRAPHLGHRELVIRDLVDLALASPRHLHPPERGPPVEQ